MGKQMRRRESDVDMNIDSCIRVKPSLEQDNICFLSSLSVCASAAENQSQVHAHVAELRQLFYTED